MIFTARLRVIATTFLLLLVGSLISNGAVTAEGRISGSDRPIILQPLSWRGGSSPFPSRIPPKVQRRPGEKSSREQESFGFLTVNRMNDKGEEMVEDEAATRDMIDSFLTRDSRNSFIGKFDKKFLLFR